jgi:pilus assembly protein CpaB
VKSRLLTITLAAVLGMLGIVAVLAYVHQANERAVSGLKAETVMVADHAIPAGTSLSKAQAADLLGTEKVPNSSLTTPAVQSVTAANQHLVISGAVAKGQVLLQNMLAKPGSLTVGISGPVLPLPQGDIAVTMEMCLDADVAGYVQPGSYIAVFDTFPVRADGAMTYTCTSHNPPTKGSVFAKIIVARVKVLSVTSVTSQGTSAAAGQLADADPTNQASSVATPGQVLVTLAATSQTMAENLVLITSAGDPTFGLLTTRSVTNNDGPFNGALEPPANP